MEPWTTPQQLVELAAFYEAEAIDLSRFDDETFVRNVEKALWGTNCWSFVEASFAIIAPACSRRPHLTRTLFRHPIRAMIAGGLEDPGEVMALGSACATRNDPYVQPSEEGRSWLVSDWPKFDPVAREVFSELWNSQF
ncbi:MAG: hypothetical protein ACRBN8_18800 [Nannocystales bacterium]